MMRASTRSNIKSHISGLQGLKVRGYSEEELLGSILPIEGPRGIALLLLEAPEDLQEVIPNPIP